MPVLAGTGAPSARQAVALSQRAAAEGADALLVLSPPGTDDPRPYYDAVGTAASTCRSSPTTSRPRRRPGSPSTCCASCRWSGVKDSTGDPARLAVEIDQVRRPASTPAAPPLLLQARAMGASGAILALANVDPDGCIRAWDGDGACQRELVNGHRAGALAGIAGLKRALAGLHGTSLATRLP